MGLNSGPFPRRRLACVHGYAPGVSLRNDWLDALSGALGARGGHASDLDDLHRTETDFSGVRRLNRVELVSINMDTGIRSAPQGMTAGASRFGRCFRWR